MSSFYHRLLLLVWQERFFVCLFVCFGPYMVKPGLSWHYATITSGLSTMSVFHFEMPPFHKLLLLCVLRACPGVINLLSSLGRIWVSYHHCVIVFRNILFLSHDFVAKQAYVVLWLNKPAFLSNHWHTVFSHFLLITIP